MSEGDIKSSIHQSLRDSLYKGTAVKTNLEVTILLNKKCALMPPLRQIGKRKNTIQVLSITKN
jgi:hypothetical protein